MLANGVNIYSFNTSTAELGIEIGRWHGLRREDRVCKECGSGEVEDTEHFVMRYVHM